jgi:hypothetical protein
VGVVVLLARSAPILKTGEAYALAQLVGTVVMTVLEKRPLPYSRRPAAQLPACHPPRRLGPEMPCGCPDDDPEGDGRRRLPSRTRRAAIA